MIFAALAGLSTAAKLSIAGNVIGGIASYAAAKEQRKQAIKDQDNQFVRMRNAAQRAGFNPLTVMRATGGQGFTGLPTISKAAAFGNIATGIFDAVRQSPIDKYNKQVRELELEQRRAEVKLAKQTFGSISKAINATKLEKMPANAVENDEIHTDEVLTRVTKTTDDKSIDNEARAILYPIVVGGRTYHLPFNPDDMDPITMLGQAGLYGALSWHDYIKDNYETQAPWTRNKNVGLVNPTLSAYQMRNFKVHKADRETTADWSLR
jgi:hypothetical protein